MTARKRMTKEKRREQIIQTAADLFGKHGFESTTTKMIAEEAGITEAVIYQHFLSKDDLYDAAIQTFITLAREYLNLVDLSEDSDIRSVFKSLCMRVQAFTNDNVKFSRMMLYSALQDHRLKNEFIASISLPMLQNMSLRLAREQEKGNVRKDIHLEQSVFTMFSVVVMHNIAKNIMHVPRVQAFDGEELIDNTLKIFFEGINDRETEK